MIGMKPHVIASISLALSTSLACAQDYPNKNIRIVTVEPGGTPDLISRLVGQGISPALGQPVIIDNRVSFIRFQSTGATSGSCRC